MSTQIPAEVEAIANAILYEGFLLYPYNESALKNRQRWNFGVLFPRAFSETNHETSMAQTECLLEGPESATLDVCLRFLQHEGEAVNERNVPGEGLMIGRLNSSPCLVPFRFGRVTGRLEIRVDHIEGLLHRISVRVWNTSSAAPDSRDAALAHSLISTHVILSVDGGRFVSMIDPPGPFRSQAAQCHNVGLWPVLAGSDGLHMLAAPIILYDHPQIAPQSPGDLFDGTEIDELLTLRILTLTDEEKLEMCKGDSRARKLLERTEALTQETVSKLHGAVVNQERVTAGDRVRLHPRTSLSHRTDIFDLALDGALASVISVEVDFEGRSYLCVVLEDDPGRDLGVAGKPGHRFFFAMDEVERIHDG